MSDQNRNCISNLLVSSRAYGLISRFSFFFDLINNLSIDRSANGSSRDRARGREVIRAKERIRPENLFTFNNTISLSQQIRRQIERMGGEDSIYPWGTRGPQSVLWTARSRFVPFDENRRLSRNHRVVDRFNEPDFTDFERGNLQGMGSGGGVCADRGTVSGNEMHGRNIGEGEEEGEKKREPWVGWVYAENRGQKPAEIFNKAAHCVGERQKGWQATYI